MRFIDTAGYTWDDGFETRDRLALELGCISIVSPRQRMVLELRNAIVHLERQPDSLSRQDVVSAVLPFIAERALS